jgi:hypothetical protein
LEEGHPLTDDAPMTWGEALAVKRGILDGQRYELAQYAGYPDQQAKIRARIRPELDAIDGEIAKHRERAEAERYWMKRSAEDGIASDLVSLVLEQSDDEGIFEVMQDIAGRFRQAATPTPVPAPEPSEQVPDIDPNNARQPFVPTPKKELDDIVDAFHPSRILVGTHDDPLGIQASAAEAERSRRRVNAEMNGQATPRWENAEAREILTRRNLAGGARRVRNLQPVEAGDMYERSQNQEG